MTTWLPTLPAAAGPRYLAIADSISADVDSGRLAPGTRLPTHRDLAQRLGVTVGTVSRGYAEAQRRGLVSCEVGRGTFVRTSRVADSPFLPFPAENLIDLSMNFPPVSAWEGALETVTDVVASAARCDTLFEYQPHVGLESHRRAGAAWIGRAGLDVPWETVVLTHGAQHAMLLALSVFTRPGDRVVTEALTYPGMTALARLLRIELHGVALDSDGVRPEAFDDACRRHRPKVFYLTPTVQNPTASVLPESRRRAIVEIARRHGVFLLEDDTYGFLTPEAPPPVTAYARDIGCYITTLSKSVAPGLRVGYLAAPAEALEGLATAVMTTTCMVSPLTAEIASALIEGGTADAIVKWQRQEATARRHLAGVILDPWAAAAIRGPGLHLWLPLPEPWRAEEFVARARALGVAVTSPETFAVGRGWVPHAVRVCLGATRTHDTLSRGLRVLAELLTGSPPPIRSTV